jgi:hypothetical protein
MVRKTGVVLYLEFYPHLAYLFYAQLNYISWERTTKNGLYRKYHSECHEEEDYDILQQDFGSGSVSGSALM